MRISDWSSDVCSSDLRRVGAFEHVLRKLRLQARQLFVVLAKLLLLRFTERGAGPDEVRVITLQQAFGLRVQSEQATRVVERLHARVQPRLELNRIAVRGQLRCERSEERRVGKEWVSTCQSRGMTDH